MRRVPSSERTKEAIRKAVEEGTDGDAKAALVTLGIQRVIEEALEAAVRETIGRDYYARRPAGAQGYRNGNRPGRLATSEGEVRYAVPQVRAVSPELLQALRRRLTGRPPNWSAWAWRSSPAAARHGTLKRCSRRPTGARSSPARRSRRSPKPCGPSTRRLRRGISVTLRRCSCSSMGSPNACGPARPAKRSWWRGP